MNVFKKMKQNSLKRRAKMYTEMLKDTPLVVEYKEDTNQFRVIGVDGTVVAAIDANNKDQVWNLEASIAMTSLKTTKPIVLKRLIGSAIGALGSIYLLGIINPLLAVAGSVGFAAYGAKEAVRGYSMIDVAFKHRDENVIFQKMKEYLEQHPLLSEQFQAAK